MSAEQRLLDLGIQLPEPPAPGGTYLPYRRAGPLVFLAGTISVLSNGTEWIGQVGAERTFDEGLEAARACGLNVLATLQSVTGSLDDVVQLLYVGGYVNAVAGYGESPAVINGASDLFVEVFGDAGRHARAAVCVAGLPKNATVEIQVTARFRQPSAVRTECRPE